MLEILAEAIFRWCPVFAGLSFSLMALMVAFGAKQDNRTPSWAFCQYVLFSSLPIVMALCLVVNALAIPIAMVVFTLLLISKKNEDGSFDKIGLFFRPLRKRSLLALLYLFSGFSVFVITIVALLATEAFIPHLQIRRLMLLAGFSLPALLVGLAYSREGQSWGKRAVLSALLAGFSSTCTLGLAWYSNNTLSVLRSSVVPDNQGRLNYHIEMGHVQTRVLGCTLLSTGVQFESEGASCGTSPSGKFEVRMSPSDVETIGHNAIDLFDSNGNKVAALGDGLTMESAF